MENDKPRIGSQIRRLRREKDMSQAILAGKIGITAPGLSNIERCKVDVRAELVVKIAEALQVSVSELFDVPDQTVSQ